jgi:hypothetical protein
MVRPWLDAGFSAVTVDLQDQINPHPLRTHLIGDVRSPAILDLLRVMRPAAVFAFPPCTHLAVSGARWFRVKGMAALIDALSIVEACRAFCEEGTAPFMIENPVSTLSTYWRQPDHKFDPWQFAALAPDPAAEAYTKRTCLWTGNGFVMPEHAPVPPTLGSKMHLLPPSPERGDLRSETPKGFAKAVFLANSGVMADLLD